MEYVQLHKIGIVVMNKILLIGTGYMAKEYLKILQFMGTDFTVLGNSKKAVRLFTRKQMSKQNQVA